MLWKPKVGTPSQWQAQETAWKRAEPLLIWVRPEGRHQIRTTVTSLLHVLRCHRRVVVPAPTNIDTVA